MALDVDVHNVDNLWLVTSVGIYWYEPLVFISDMNRGWYGQYFVWR
jgi:hypothetical protein